MDADCIPRMKGGRNANANFRSLAFSISAMRRTRRTMTTTRRSTSKRRSRVPRRRPRPLDWRLPTCSPLRFDSLALPASRYQYFSAVYIFERETGEIRLPFSTHYPMPMPTSAEASSCTADRCMSLSRGTCTKVLGQAHPKVLYPYLCCLCPAPFPLL